jgi:putative ABC transport system substrate-binding protein
MPFDHLRRREFITLLAGTAVAWPLAARAQQPALPVIGFLSSGSPDLDADRVRALRSGLGETGYVEGRNLVIELRWAEGRYDRLAALAADLVRRQVAVIVVNGPPATAAAKAATTTIPIVFQIGGDPVASGLVAGLNRPGGNLTGVTNLTAELGPKRLQLLHELVPTATVIALLVNPTNPISNANPTAAEAIQAAARSLGLQLSVLEAGSERDFDAAFASLAQSRAGALMIGPDGLFNSLSEQLAALTLRHAVPTIFSYRDPVAVGGLMSYGGSVADLYREVGVYTGRILKGAKPADLPVMQPTKFELVINLKTARTLGLQVPASLLASADEVIE